MNKKDLTAAVKQYAPLIEEGKTDEEIKAIIKADPKQYDEAALAEIFQAVIDYKPATKETYTVEQPFRCITNFDILYNVGDDVSTMEQSRLNDLIEKGLVKKG